MLRKVYFVLPCTVLGLQDLLFVCQIPLDLKKSFAKLQTKKNSFEVLKEFLNINTEVCKRRQGREEETEPCAPLQPQHKRKT